MFAVTFVAFCLPGIAIEFVRFCACVGMSAYPLFSVTVAGFSAYPAFGVVVVKSSSYSHVFGYNGRGILCYYQLLGVR